MSHCNAQGRLRPLFWQAAGLLMLSAGVLGSLAAQVSYTWTYQGGAGNPSGLNTEPDFNQSGWTAILNGGLAGNQWSQTLSLPFPFSFFGQNVAGLKATANGVLTFTTSASALPSNNSLLPSAALPPLSIACFWDAFTSTPPTGTNDQVQTKVFGSAPNRQFWIRWHSFEWGVISFGYVSVVLEESSNRIYLVDQYGSPNSVSLSATVGLQKDNGFAVQAGGTQVPLAAAGSGYSDNSYYAFTPYLLPPQDLTPVALLSPLPEDCDPGAEIVQVRIANLGQLDAGQVQAFCQLDNGPILGPQALSGGVMANDTALLTFSQPLLTSAGLHQLRVWTSASGDPNPANDTLTVALRRWGLVQNFPYREEFENSDGGWLSGGSQSSWEWGIPAGQTIVGAASGIRAWTTGRTSAHNAFENSWLLSPCFDFSNLSSDTWITLSAWWESEPGRDGAAIQASFDNGGQWLNIQPSVQQDWYNSANIASLPGGQPFGWSGNGSASSGGWRRVSARLPATLAGKPRVRFRILFAADGQQQYDGFALDDVVIGTPPPASLGPDRYFCEGETISAGPATLAYLWSNGQSTPEVSFFNLSGQPIIDSLLAVRVSDAWGQFRRDSLRFSMQLPLQLLPPAVADAQCYGEASGSIELHPAGGQAPYFYAWSNGSNQQQAAQLAAGTYTCTVTDALGCSLLSDTLRISQPDSLSVSASLREPLCFGSADGSISLTLSGGSAPYQVLWASGSSGSILDSLGAGAYEAEIRDAQQCLTQRSYILAQPDSLSIRAELRDASCPESADAFIALDVAGGRPPYQFLWPAGPGADSLGGLLPGFYEVWVDDSAGCGPLWRGFQISYADSLPRASFSFEPAGGTVGFRDSSAGAQNWHWSFGDGDSSREAHPVHIYTQNGSYTVRLIVENACGRDTAYAQIEMLQVGIALQASEPFLFPNPTSGTLHLRLPAGETGTLALYGYDGRAWAHFPIPAAEAVVMLTLPPSLPPGVYLAEIIRGQQRWRQLLRVE